MPNREPIYSARDVKEIFDFKSVNVVTDLFRHGGFPTPDLKLSGRNYWRKKTIQKEIQRRKEKTENHGVGGKPHQANEKIDYIK